jgi:hypothetical protein
VVRAIFAHAARGPRLVWLGAARFAGLYIVLDLNKLYALRYGADLGTFFQSLLNFLAWFGLAGAVLYDRRLGLSVLALAIINGIAYYVLVLHSGFAPVHPRYSLHVRYWFQDTAFLAEVLAPFAFAPLALGWRLLLAAPPVAEITMDRAWNYPMARAGTHYSVPLVTLMAIGAAIAMARRPKLAAYAVACSCVMGLFFNVTVLHFGRHLYPPDPAGYAQARAVALSARPYVYTSNHQGAFVVASPNLNVRLVPARVARAVPAWNTR